jgi:hypothetical protein
MDETFQIANISSATGIKRLATGYAADLTIFRYLVAWMMRLPLPKIIEEQFDGEYSVSTNSSSHLSEHPPPLRALVPLLNTSTTSVRTGTYFRMRVPVSLRGASQRRSQLLLCFAACSATSSFFHQSSSTRLLFLLVLHPLSETAVMDGSPPCFVSKLQHPSTDHHCAGFTPLIFIKPD